MHATSRRTRFGRALLVLCVAAFVNGASSTSVVAQAAPGASWHDERQREGVGVKKPLLLVLAVAGAAFAALRRRRSQADATLWREATSDNSH